MAGATVTVTISIEDAQVRAALARLVGRLRDPARAMRDIGEYLLRATDDRFRAQRAPDGTPWAPNSEVTLMRYLERKRGLSSKRLASGGRNLTARGAKLLGAKRILRQSGALQDTVRYQLAEGGRAVAVGTNRVYGAMQQFGGTKAQWPHLWGDIPARPFLGVSRSDGEELLRLVRRHLEREAR